MPRYRGHFYNWYDTRTLAPLAPAYISTVDSGNLAGYLVTLRAGLLEIAERAPVIDASFLEGLEDLVDLVDEEVERGSRAARRPPATCRACGRSSRACARSWASGQPPPTAWKTPRGRDSRPPVRRQRAAARVRGAAARRGAADVHAAGVRGSRVLAGTGGRRRGGAARRSRAPAPPGQSSSSAPSGSRRLPTISSRKPSSSFLFDEERQLFSIGFNVVDGRLDASYYDTLASEARLASFLAIATGKISHEHWFKLGRSLTPSGASRALLSWSASMFEYLMPLLVMRTYPGHAAARDLRRRRPAADPVRRAARRAVGHLRVGVPRAGSRGQLSIPRLRRARARPQARAGRRPGDRAVRELPRGAAGARRGARQPRAPARRRRSKGRYGFYEAIDYTIDRLPKDHVRRHRRCPPTWRTTRA